MSVRRVPITEVDRFDVGIGYFGIELLLLHSYQKITVNVIQKSNWATWTGRRTRADVLVEKLNEVVRSRRVEHGREGPSSER